MRRAGVPTVPTPRRGAAPPPTRQASIQRLRAAQDGVGSLLFVFVGATLVMVAAVIVVGIVESWWVLLPVMAVDFATTAAVVAYILHLLADDGEVPGQEPAMTRAPRARRPRV